MTRAKREFATMCWSTGRTSISIRRGKCRAMRAGADALLSANQPIGVARGAGGCEDAGYPPADAAKRRTGGVLHPGGCSGGHDSPRERRRTLEGPAAGAAIQSHRSAAISSSCWRRTRRPISAELPTATRCGRGRKRTTWAYSVGILGFDERARTLAASPSRRLRRNGRKMTLSIERSPINAEYQIQIEP